MEENVIEDCAKKQKDFIRIEELTQQCIGYNDLAYTQIQETTHSLNSYKANSKQYTEAFFLETRDSLSLYSWYVWDRGQIPNMAVTGPNR